MNHKGGPALYYSDYFAEKSKILLHGVGLNIAGEASISESYLLEIKKLKHRYNPIVISDHLCFNNTKTHHSYELLPIPRTKQDLKRIIERIHFVQEFLSSQISIENISAYVEYEKNDYCEGEFFSEITKATGCGVLFDINNLFVNAFNFSRHAEKELFEFPLHSITQLHMAGHTDCGDYLFDTHDKPVCEGVLQLLKILKSKINLSKIPIILENDDSDTPLELVFSEWEKINQYVL